MKSSVACLVVPLVLILSSSGCGGPVTDQGPVRTPGVDEAALTPKQLLGKRLFEDPALSEPAGQACASCHQASLGFTGNAGSPVSAVAQGAVSGVLGGRNVPTILYASLSPRFAFVLQPGDDGAPAPTPVGGQFWDGRAVDLAAQALGPFLNPKEMNNADAAAVVSKVRGSRYASLFASVYGEAMFDDVDAAYASAGEAIAAFELTATFHPFSSRFDQSLRGAAQLTAAEARGFELFKDPQKGNCLACHVGTVDSHQPADWPFTDHTYDTLGVPRNQAIPDNADPAHVDLGLCGQPGLAEAAPEGFDLDSLCGAFKVPTLRNIAATAPYMHNGFFSDLRDVVRFYATRDTNPDLWYPLAEDGRVRKFDDLPQVYWKNVNTAEVPYDRKPGDAPRLTDAEIDDLVAFLGTLTDE